MSNPLNEYIRKTPSNTNPMVLRSIVESQGDSKDYVDQQLQTLYNNRQIGHIEYSTEEQAATLSLQKLSVAFRWDLAASYADDGKTLYTGTKGNGAAAMWYSEPFEYDTDVTIRVQFANTNANLRQYCACLPLDANLESISQYTQDLHYLEQIGTASTEVYEAHYMVRAGYRMAIVNYNNTAPTLLEAECVK
jgi:hypothetical protein